MWRRASVSLSKGSPREADCAANFIRKTSSSRTLGRVGGHRTFGRAWLRRAGGGAFPLMLQQHRKEPLSIGHDPRRPHPMRDPQLTERTRPKQRELHQRPVRRDDIGRGHKGIRGIRGARPDLPRHVAGPRARLAPWATSWRPGAPSCPACTRAWAHLPPHRAFSHRRTRPLPRWRLLEPERPLGWVPRPWERRRLRGQPQMREDRDDGGALLDVAHDSAPAATWTSEHILPRKLVSASRPRRCERLAEARRRGRARCARSRSPARASPSVPRRSSPPRRKLARASSSLRHRRSLRSRCRRAHAAPRALRAAPRSPSTTTPAPARR